MPKFCRECGKPLREGAKFCSECGAKIRMNTEQSIQSAAEPASKPEEISIAVPATPSAPAPAPVTRAAESDETVPAVKAPDIAKALTDSPVSAGGR